MFTHRKSTAGNGVTHLCRGGFTLVEVMIVVTLMGILASVAITASSSFGPQALESTARVLAADIQLARSLAVQHNTEWAVEFDTTNNIYEVIHVGSGNPPPAVNPLDPTSSTTGKYIIDLTEVAEAGFDPAPVSLGGVALATDQSRVKRIVFGPRGGTGPTVSQDTIVWLTQNYGKQIRFVRLTVSWVTGAVFIDKSDIFGNSVADSLFNME